MKIRERAIKSVGCLSGWDGSKVEAYDKGATEMIEVACEQFRKEVEQFKNILNVVKKNSGSLIDIDRSVEQFRKVLVGE